MVAAAAPAAVDPALFPKLDVGEAKGYPQARFFACRHPKALYLSGIGGGKTDALLYSAFRYALEWPGSIQIITEPRYNQLADILFPKIHRLFGEWRSKYFRMTESVPPNIYWRNDSQIWLRSAEVNEGLYGPDVARVLMDEINLGQQREAYRVLLGRVRQQGYPKQILLAGKAKGRNWFWHRFLKGVHVPQDKRPFVLGDTHYFFADTQDNQHNPAGYFETLLEEYGGPDSPFARQELFCEFLEMAGQVFEQFRRALHVRVAPAELGRRLGGVDFGAVSPTALVAVGEAAGRLYCYREWYKHQATLEETARAMRGMEEEAGVGAWVADPSGKREINALRQLGFRVQPARHGNKLALRVQLFGARLSPRSADGLPGVFIDPSCVHLISELEGLMWRKQQISSRSEEIMTDEFERGFPDHAFDAATNALAEWDLAPRPFKRPQPRKLWGPL